MNIEQEELELKKLAQGHNLAAKNFKTWDLYIDELKRLSADVESIKVHAVEVCHRKALRINSEIDRQLPAKIIEEKPKKKRYQSEMMRKIGECNSIEDFIKIAEKAA